MGQSDKRLGVLPGVFGGINARGGRNIIDGRGTAVAEVLRRLWT